MPDDALLARANAYLHAAPLSGSLPEEIGPFTLFRTTTTWNYYARPRPGHEQSIDVASINRVVERCVSLDLPVNFEWVVESAPDLADAAAAAGLHVERYPLLVVEPDAFRPVGAPAGVSAILAGTDQDLLIAGSAVAHVGFGVPGTAVGTAGAEERDRIATEVSDARRAGLVDRAERVLTVTAVAIDDADGVVASGAHQPVGTATEIVGVATLPRHRRRGLGAAVTSVLVADARIRGIELVLLSADGDDVARVYERIGFRRIGSTGAAEPARADPLPDEPNRS